jgi:hypothetical protein
MRIAGVAALCLVSCAGPRGSGSVSIAPVEGLSWQRALHESTRRAQPYDGAIRQADVRATLITPRVRKAFLDARSEFQGSFADQSARELIAFGEPDPGVDIESRPAPESEQQMVFFVAMYVADQKNRDISAGYTIWDTTLTRGDALVLPLRIEAVRGSPSVKDIFPYVDRFDDLYLLRFPLTGGAGQPFLSPGGEPLRLRIQSALADAVLEWTLQE